MSRISLVEMRPGEKGKIVEIGSYKSKLNALGIKEGDEIIKISAQPMKGPVVFQKGNTQVAIGFRSAHRIIVEVNRR